MKPRRLPRLKRTNDPPQSNQNNDINTNKNTQLINNSVISRRDDIQNNNIDSDFIRKKNKIRERHIEDYAISLAPNREDIVSEDIKLYENKDINLEAPKIKENIDLENTEFYIESIHHDQYYKINQIKKEEKKKEEILGDSKKGGVKKRKKTQKKLTAYEQAMALENKLYMKFDKELTDIITKTLSKVTLIFLFAQGLLAGMGLLHILINLTYKNFETFLNQLAPMIIIMYSIFHALTFVSLVGNGIKFFSSYQKYKIISLQISNNLSEFTKLRQNMIFSGILLVCFSVVFALEIFLATYVQKINLNSCMNDPNDANIKLKEDEFNPFKYTHIALDFVVIILFILNIFDLNVQDENNENNKRPINLNFYLGSEGNNNDGGVQFTQT
jgi:hypothetical protein